MYRTFVAMDNYCYHVLDDPRVTDAVYDETYRKLQGYEARYPQTFHPKSPTQCVGAECTNWPPEEDPLPKLQPPPAMHPEDWKDWPDLNTSSLWLIESRDKSGAHSNNFHGNWVPQIPRDMIVRFTQPGDNVLDPFMGSGTTLLECIYLGRNGVGIDINKETFKNTRALLRGIENPHEAEIVLKRANCITLDYPADTFHLSLVHPPYLDIIRFNEGNPECLGEMELDDFLGSIETLAEKLHVATVEGGHAVVVCGDVWGKKPSRLIPLCSLVMNVFLGMSWTLKGIVVKNTCNTQAKQKSKNLWRSRCIKNGTFTFDFEQILVFRKVV